MTSTRRRERSERDSVPTATKVSRKPKKEAATSSQLNDSTAPSGRTLGTTTTEHQKARESRRKKPEKETTSNSASVAPSSNATQTVTYTSTTNTALTQQQGPAAAPAPSAAPTNIDSKVEKRPEPVPETPEQPPQKEQRRPRSLTRDEDEVVENSPLGRFARFNRKLGAGSYKQVYLGFDNDTGREVAWNIITYGHMSSHEKKRIQDEINITKVLEHPRIISMISAWKNSQNEEVILITERVTGGSLRNYVNRLGSENSLKIKVIRNWSLQILEGLDYLHTHKPNHIIHRDIKLDNIFIHGNSGQVLIGDLGLSAWLAPENSNNDGNRANNALGKLNQSVVGTPEFMAPELYSESYGTAVDIYAFGMCLIEMVTRQFPFAECSTTMQVYNKVMRGEQPRVVKLIQNLELRALIESCIQSDNTKRLSASELLQHKFLTSTEGGDELCTLLQDLEEDSSNTILAADPGPTSPVVNAYPDTNRVSPAAAAATIAPGVVTTNFPAAAELQTPPLSTRPGQIDTDSATIAQTQQTAQPGGPLEPNQVHAGTTVAPQNQVHNNNIVQQTVAAGNLPIPQQHIQQQVQSAQAAQQNLNQTPTGVDQNQQQNPNLQNQYEYQTIAAQQQPPRHPLVPAIQMQQQYSQQVDPQHQSSSAVTQQGGNPMVLAAQSALTPSGQIPGQQQIAVQNQQGPQALQQQLHPQAQPQQNLSQQHQATNPAQQAQPAQMQNQVQQNQQQTPVPGPAQVTLAQNQGLTSSIVPSSPAGYQQAGTDPSLDAYAEPVIAPVHDYSPHQFDSIYDLPPQTVQATMPPAQMMPGQYNSDAGTPPLPQVTVGSQQPQSYAQQNQRDSQWQTQAHQQPHPASPLPRTRSFLVKQEVPNQTHSSPRFGDGQQPLTEANTDNFNNQQQYHAANAALHATFGGPAAVPNNTYVNVPNPPTYQPALQPTVTTPPTNNTGRQLVGSSSPPDALPQPGQQSSFVPPKRISVNSNIGGTEYVPSTAVPTLQAIPASSLLPLQNQPAQQPQQMQQLVQEVQVSQPTTVTNAPGQIQAPVSQQTAPAAQVPPEVTRTGRPVPSHGQIEIIPTVTLFYA